MFDYSLPYSSRRQPLLARNVVATSQPLAVQAGVRALQDGGNAVDAALAAAITLTVVEPTANGAGSDAFAIVWDGSKLHGLNASGRSPAAWTPERFANLAEMPGRGWNSVTVPGAVAGWVALSEGFGRLPFERLFDAAVFYARNGFAVTPVIAAQWDRIAEKYAGQPGFDETFLPNGRPPAPGQVFANPDLAETLEAIAGSKGEAFYRGALAERMVRHAAEHGGTVTLDDFADNRIDWCGTIGQSFGDGVLHEIPPNTQGLAALIALGVLDRMDLARFEPDSPQAIHLQIEAAKLGIADADTFVGDPDAMTHDVRSFLDKEYLDRRAALVDPARAREAEAGTPQSGGTVYIAAGDAEGMMVSFIQSNYEGFGSGVVVPGTGISLHNRGAGFSLEPGHPNRVGPRKRPYHTIIPGFFEDATGRNMAFGVMGGPMQAQGHVQMVVRTRTYGQNPQAASDAPRWRFVEGLRVAVEAEMSAATIRDLIAMGHDIKQETPDAAWGFGGAQLVCHEPSGYVAGSDHRKDGQAVGF